MSTRVRVGLLGLSIQMSFVSSGRIRSAMSTSMVGEKLTCTPCAEATWVK